jgi:putative hemolysin
VESTIEIPIIVGLILLNGFFAGAEIAVLTARRNRLQVAAEGGSRGARAALSLLENTSRFLSTVQVGITGVSTFAAAYGGVTLVDQLGQWLSRSSTSLIANNGKGIALALVTGVIAFLSLVLGELVPKRFALAYAEQLAQFVAIPMRLFSIVARPAVALLGFVTTGILNLLGVDSQAESQVSVDDIESLLETGKQQGVLEHTEHEVAFEALQLRNRRVRDIMRPRIDIDAVDVDTPYHEVVGVVAMSGFSRLPVYEGNLDHIVGFIYNKDVLQQFYLGRDIQLRSMLREPLFIPENLTLDRVLTLFQERRTQLAIVLDEFGGTRGMVTFEDVLEELVGEIHDEHRHDEEQRIVQRDPRSWLVDGRLPIYELQEHLPDGVHLAPDAESATTVGGFVLAKLDELPKLGNVVQCGDVHIEVVDMDGTRVDRLLVVLDSERTS